MTKFNVKFSESDAGYGSLDEKASRRRPGRRRILRLAAGLLLLSLFAAAAAAYLYWRSFYDTPQYSLALLIQASRTDDQAAIDKLVDTNAVVDDFMPQLTGKAIELYGRGAPPAAIAKIEKIAGPLIPAIKDRARAELPGLIRRKTQRFAEVPFAAMVLGADKYLDISIDGEYAIAKSKLPKHSFEVKMRRNGPHWQIVGVRDDQLAARVANAIGQEMLELASRNGGLVNAGTQFGIENYKELIRRAEESLK